MSDLRRVASFGDAPSSWTAPGGELPSSRSPPDRDALVPGEPPCSVSCGAHLELGDVCLNDLQDLRRFEVRSNVERPLLVKLRCNLNGLDVTNEVVTFQLQNDNLPDGADGSGAESTYAANQLFNTVNLISEVLLPPRGAVSVILLLRSANLGVAEEEAEDDHGDAELTDEEDDKEQAEYAADHAAASKTQATDATKAKQRPLDDSSADRGGAEENEKDRRGRAQRKQQAQAQQLLDNAETLVAEAAARAEKGSSSLPLVSFRLTANVCRSSMELDKNEMVFADCVPKGDYNEEVTVWNRSEIPLRFEMTSMDSVEASCFMFFVNNEDGREQILGSIEVEGLSHIRLLVQFRPTEVGEDDRVITLENVNNARNVEKFTIHSNVTAELHHNGLVLTNQGDVEVAEGLEFGDCYAGRDEPYTRELTLQNVTSRGMEVSLSTDNEEVIFILHDENGPDDESDEEEEVVSQANVGGRDMPFAEKRGGVDADDGPPASDASAGDASTESSLQRVRTGGAWQGQKGGEHKRGKPTVQDTGGSGLLQPKKAKQSETREAATEAKKQEKRRGLAVDSLHMSPGQAKTILVCFKPLVTDSMHTWRDDPKPPTRKLKRSKFRMWLRCADLGTGKILEKYNKMVQCKARVCTSWIFARVRDIFFGDANVASETMRAMQLRNLSELPCRVRVSTGSRAVTFPDPEMQGGSDIVIPPKQTHELTVMFKPVLVDPDWKHQITIQNLANSDNTLTISMRANISDRNRMTFHSLFYKVVTNRKTPHMLDFGQVTANFSSVESLTLVNQSKKNRVCLSISAESAEFKLYRVSTDREREEHARVQQLAKVDKLNGGVSVDAGGEADSTEDLTKLQQARREKREKMYDRAIGDSDSQALQQQLEVRQKGKASRKEEKKEEEKKEKAEERARVLDALLSGNDVVQASGKSLAKRGAVGKYELDLISSNAQRAARDSGQGREDGNPILGRSRSLGLQKQIAKSPSLDNIAQIVAPKNAAAAALTAPIASPSKPQKQKVPDARRPIAAGPSRFVDNVMSTLKPVDMPAAVWSDAVAEANYIDSVHTRKSALVEYIQEGHLIQCKDIVIKGGEQEEILVVFTPTEDKWASTSLKPCSTNLKFTLTNFDQATAARELGPSARAGIDPQEIAPRLMPIRAAVCLSRMSLLQVNINFGAMFANEERSKVITVHNLSEVPLLFSVHKSLSINSKRVQIYKGDQRTDVASSSRLTAMVRPYGSQTINLRFSPSLGSKTGLVFEERLEMENALDRKGATVVTVKAKVYKPQKFTLQSALLDFGATILNERSRTLRVILKNTSQQARVFQLSSRLQADQAMRVDVFFQLDMSSAKPVKKIGGLEGDESVEDALDRLRRSLKKAARKSKADKVRKLQKQILALENSLGNDGDDADEAALDSAASDTSDSEDESDDEERFKPRSRRKRVRNDGTPRRNGVIFSCEPGATMVIFTTFVVRLPADEKAIRFDKQKVLSQLIEARDDLDTDSKMEIELKAVIFGSRMTWEQTAQGGSGASWAPPVLRQALEQEEAADNVSTELKGSALKSTKQHHSIMSSRSATTGKSASVERSPVGSLVVSPKNIDLGEIQVNQLAEATFTISNSSHASSKPLTFVILVDNVQSKLSAESEDAASAKDLLKFNSQQNGVIKPHQKVTIDLGFCSKAAGKQSVALTVRNLSSQQEVKVLISTMVVHPRYIQCPDVALRDNSFEFGDVYIDVSQNAPRYAHSRPFRVQSQSEETVFLSFTSNLKKNIVVFRDAELRVPLTESFPLFAMSEQTVYIAFKVKTVAGGTSDVDAKANEDELKRLAEIYDKGETREFLAGIQVEVLNESQKRLRLHTFKFTATIGKSILKLSESKQKKGVEVRTIDLGNARSLNQEFSGSFTVQNLSKYLPAKFQVLPTAEHVTMVCDRVTQLSGREQRLSVESHEDDEGPSEGIMSEATINFTITNRSYGMVDDEIILQNLLNQEQKLRVRLRLFTDDRSLEVAGNPDPDPESSGPGIGIQNNGHESHSRLVCAPIYVRAPQPDEVQAPYSLDGLDWTKAEVLQISQKFILQNLLHDVDLDVKVLSHLELGARKFDEKLDDSDKQHWTSLPLDENAPSILKSNVPAVRGQSILMNKGEQAMLEVDVLPPPFKHKFNLAKLKKGNLAGWSGKLLLQRNLPGSADVAPGGDTKEGAGSAGGVGRRVAKVVQVSGQIGTSVGSLEEGWIDAGTVGSTNSWQTVDLVYTVENLCEIPMQIQVVSLPSYLTVETEADTIPGRPAAKDGVEAKRSLKRYKAMLHPSMMKEAQIRGQREEQIVIMNMNNDFNMMRLTVSTKVAYALLKFARVHGSDDSAHQKIRVPELVVPALEGDEGVDQWFAMQNLSDATLDMQLQVKLNPDVASVVDVTFKSRAENAVVSQDDSISLQPGEEMEVRVIVSAKPGARVLPASCVMEDAADKSKINSFYLGSLKVIAALDEAAGRHKPYEELIELHGRLTQGTTFTVTKPKLKLRQIEEANADMEDWDAQNGLQQIEEGLMQDTFEIANPSPISDLLFDAIVHTSQGSSSAHIILQPSKGTIKAGASVLVTVIFDPSAIDDPSAVPATATIFVVDREAPKSSTLSIAVNLSQWQRRTTIEQESITAGLTRTAMLRAVRKGPVSTLKVPGIGGDAQGTSRRGSGSISPSSELSDEAVESFSLIKSLEGTLAESEAPVANLILRGCTPLGGSQHRFEVDMGQQLVGAEPQTWELTLENNGSQRIEFSIRKISQYGQLESDDVGGQWLEINKTKGAVRPNTSVRITLSVLTKRMGRFSTYLVIENTQERSNIKTLRVRSEVAATLLHGGVNAAKTFSVMIEGHPAMMEPVSLVEYGRTYNGRLHKQRCFQIINHTDTSLDFVLRSTIEEEDMINVDFSVTNASLKKFNILTLPPKQSTRVYIFLRPMLPKAAFAESGSVEQEITVFISSRLVKNYQLNLQLTATIVPQTLRLEHHKQLLFRGSRVLKEDSAAGGASAALDDNSGRVSPIGTPASSPMKEAGGGPIAFGTPSKNRNKRGVERQIKLETKELRFNLRNSSDKPVTCVLRNNTQYFLVSQEGSDCTQEEELPSIDGHQQVTVAAGAPAVLIVRPKPDIVKNKSEEIMREKYIEEHITIYNAEDLREFRWVRLRLSMVEDTEHDSGADVEFHSAPGRSKAHPFSFLEESSVQFLRVAGGFWAEYLLRLQSLDGRERLALEGGAAAAGGAATVEGSPPCPSVPAAATALHLARQMDELALDSSETGQEYRKLLHELHYLTDELVFNALKEHEASSAFHLASLLFTVVLRSEPFDSFSTAGAAGAGAFGGVKKVQVAERAEHHQEAHTRQARPRVLQDWVSRLSHFLSFFPEKRDDIGLLRSLLDAYR